MADLDDFFAKKDKKKSKTKKFLTPEEIVKKLEDTSKKIEQQPTKPLRKLDSETTTESSTGATTTADSTSEQVIEQPEVVKDEEIPPPEEEWKEFEEVERKDYSGLKIGQLQINDDDQEQHNSGQEGDYDEFESDGEGGFTKDRKLSGPWKQVTPADEVTQIPMEVEKPSSKIYISPAFKNAPKPSQKLKNRNAPDITNAEYFPTLGAARPEEQRKKKNEPAFEEVRHGGRLQKIQETQSDAPNPVGNRFKTLDDDDS